MVELLKKLNSGDMVAYLNPVEMEMLFEYFEHKNFDIEQIGHALRNCHISLVDELKITANDNYGLEKLASKIFMARKVLENRKINNFHQLQTKSVQLLEKMRNYVEGKYDLDTEITISYRMINGDEKLNYKDLKLGETFELNLVTFNLDPHIGMISNYTKTIFKGKKQKENWDENLKMPENSYTRQKKNPHHYSRTSEFDRVKSETAIKKEIDRLVMQIFSVERKPDDPMFNDPEFKKLYEEYIALKQETIRSAHEIDYLRKNNNQQNIHQVMEKKGKQLYDGFFVK